MQDKNIVSEELAKIFNELARDLANYKKLKATTEIFDFLIPRLETIRAGEKFPFQSIQILPCYSTFRNIPYTIFFTATNCDKAIYHMSSKEIFTQIVDFIQDNLTVQQMHIIYKLTEEDISLITEVYNKAILKNIQGNIQTCLNFVFLETLHRLKPGDIMIQGIQYNDMNMSLIDLLDDFRKLQKLPVISLSQVAREFFVEKIYKETLKAIKSNFRLQEYGMVEAAIACLSIESICERVKQVPQEELKAHFVESMVELCLVSPNHRSLDFLLCEQSKQYEGYINRPETRKFLEQLCKNYLGECFYKGDDGVFSLKVGKKWRDVITGIEDIVLTQSKLQKFFNLFNTNSEEALKQQTVALDELRAFISSMTSEIDEAFAVENARVIMQPQPQQVVVQQPQPQQVVVQQPQPQQVAVQQPQQQNHNPQQTNIVSEEIAKSLNDLAARKSQEFNYRIYKYFIDVCQSIRAGDELPFATKDKNFFLSLVKQGNAYKICIFGHTEDEGRCIITWNISRELYNSYAKFIDDNTVIYTDKSRKVSEHDIKLFQKIYENQALLFESNDNITNINKHTNLQFFRLLSRLKPGDELICQIRYLSLSMNLKTLIEKFPELKNLTCIKQEEEMPMNEDQVQPQQQNRDPQQRNIVSEEIAKSLNDLAARKSQEFSYQACKYFIDVCQSIRAGDELPFATKDKNFFLSLVKQGNAYKICIFGVTKDVSSCIVIWNISRELYHSYAKFIHNNTIIYGGKSLKVTEDDIKLFQTIYADQKLLLESNDNIRNMNIHAHLQFLRLLSLLKPGDQLIRTVKYMDFYILLKKISESFPQLKNATCIRQQQVAVQPQLQQEIPANKDQIQDVQAVVQQPQPQQEEEIPANKEKMQPANNFVNFVQQENHPDERVVDEQGDVIDAFYGFHRTEYLMNKL